MKMGKQRWYPRALFHRARCESVTSALCPIFVALSSSAIVGLVLQWKMAVIHPQQHVEGLHGMYQEPECNHRVCPKIVELSGAFKGTRARLYETGSGLKSSLIYIPGAASSSMPWKRREPPKLPVWRHQTATNDTAREKARDRGKGRKRAIGRESDVSSGRYCIRWASLPHIHPSPPRLCIVLDVLDARPLFSSQCSLCEAFLYSHGRVWGFIVLYCDSYH